MLDAISCDYAHLQHRQDARPIVTGEPSESSASNQSSMEVRQSVDVFVQLLFREMFVFNEMSLTKVELDKLQDLFKNLAADYPNFAKDVTRVVEQHQDDDTTTPISADMLGVLCHAMMIGARNTEATLLLRLVSTLIQNGCSVSRIDSLLTVLSESSTESYLAAYLSANYDNVSCISSVVRVYQNIFSFLLANFDRESTLKKRSSYLLLPLGVIEVFSKIMRYFNVFQIHSASQSAAHLDMDEACSVWNAILRVLNSAIEYYEEVVDAFACELEEFKGINFTYFDETRSRAEKVLSLLDHIGDELVSKLIIRLRNIIVIDDSDSVVAMMLQVKLYTEAILKHYDGDSKHARAQRTLKTRICRVVANIGDVYV